MSAADDYPYLAWIAAGSKGYMMPEPIAARRALDEIDKLRYVVEALRAPHGRDPGWELARACGSTFDCDTEGHSHSCAKPFGHTDLHVSDEMYPVRWSR